MSSMTQHPDCVLQIMNAAAQRAYVNFKNHIATNFSLEQSAGSACTLDR